MSDLPAVRASDADRERSVVRLREAAADGRLTLDEFTERMHAVYAARTHDELDTLLRDLPDRTQAAAPPAKRRRVVSVMGNTEVDLRGTAARADEISVSVFCAMGNAVVIVPRGVHVELDAFAFMGNKRVAGGSEAEPGAPVVRVTGLVTMGNLVVRHA